MVAVVTLAVGAEVSLLDDSSFSPQEMMVRLKRNMRIMYKFLLIFFLNQQWEEKRLKCHKFIYRNQKLLVDNPELLNLHKRLSNQSHIFANRTLMSTKCQDLYTIVVEVIFTRLGKDCGGCLTVNN